MTLTDANRIMVEYYKNAVEEVHRADEALGDSNAARVSFFETLKANNSNAVAQAQRVIDSFNNMTDNEARAVVGFILSREKSFGTFAQEFAKAANPVVEDTALSDEARNALYQVRSDNQKIATSMYATLSIILDKSDLEELPECPKGRRGGAPGPRGKMGRKIPTGYAWTVNGEYLGKLTTKDIAKACDIKIAELRLKLESLFPDALPDEFSTSFTTVDGRSIALQGKLDDSDPDESDDDDDDDEDEDED